MCYTARICFSWSDFFGISISGASSTRGVVARPYFQVVKIPLLENPVSFSGFLKLFEHRSFHSDLQIWKCGRCVFGDIMDFRELPHCRSETETFAWAQTGVHSPLLTPPCPEIGYGLLRCSHIPDGATSL